MLSTVQDCDTQPKPRRVSLDRWLPQHPVPPYYRFACIADGSKAGYLKHEVRKR